MNNFADKRECIRHIRVSKLIHQNVLSLLALTRQYHCQEMNCTFIEYIDVDKGWITRSSNPETNVAGNIAFNKILNVRNYKYMLYTRPWPDSMKESLGTLNVKQFIGLANIQLDVIKLKLLWTREEIIRKLFYWCHLCFQFWNITIFT